MMSSNITGAVVSSTPGIRYTIPPSTTSASASSAAAAVKINFIASLPLLSPVSTATGVVGQAPQSAVAAHGTPAISSNLSTPKKDFLDAVILEKIRQQLRYCGSAAAAATATATTVCDIQQLRIESTGEIEHLSLLKDRYLLSSSSNSKETPGLVAPSTRQQIVDLSTSNLKCVDVFTEQNFLCKIINEPLDKVQLAYFNLQQDSDGCTSAIYGHNLIRRAHDIVPLSKNRTYVIIPDRTANGSSAKSSGGVAYNSSSSSSDNCLPVYEDLHTYIRNKRRLSESEARALFHQISQTVQVCHRNGIILRDLKLKRFFFVDAERTKLEYESLEGSMILDDPDNDLLSDKIGCPLYTAPELLCPHPTYNGKPADMWSLGVILYTMLVGQYPFYEKNNCNLIAIIRHCQVQLPTALSKSVCFLLRLLLRKNHTERILAEDIFYVPWLKEQKPYYMSIPVDVQFSSDEDENEDEDMEYDMATASDLA